MAFFDSPKNRAIWEREMKSLRSEKERRRQEGYVPDQAVPGKVKRSDSDPRRRRITLNELEQILAEASGGRRRERDGQERKAVRRRQTQAAAEPQNVMRGRELE